MKRVFTWAAICAGALALNAIGWDAAFGQPAPGRPGPQSARPGVHPGPGPQFRPGPQFARPGPGPQFRPGPGPRPGPRFAGPHPGPRFAPGSRPGFGPHPGHFRGFRPHGHRHGGYYFSFGLGYPYPWPYYRYYYPYYPYYPYPYPPYGASPGAIYGPPVAPSATIVEGEFSGDCQMIREYQTKVIIDGKTVDAYGDACLKADGTWERGPVKLAPQ